MNPSEFEGRVFGPKVWRVAADSVRDFVELTGDDPDRWVDFAPPGFAASALFAVAPELLRQLSDRSVVHGEQTFSWEGSLPIGAQFEVTGNVTRVRERGGVHFVTFEMSVVGDGATVLTGRSLFLVSGEPTASQAGDEREEPPHSDRGAPDDNQVAASRADLVRYASATRDWNPVHWDHEAGVAAGFPGIVVHGLLQAGWALRAATPWDGNRPFEHARFRFRNPLLPAQPAAIEVETSGLNADVTISRADTEYLTAAIELFDE